MLECGLVALRCWLESWIGLVDRVIEKQIQGGGKEEEMHPKSWCTVLWTFGMLELKETKTSLVRIGFCSMEDFFFMTRKLVQSTWIGEDCELDTQLSLFRMDMFDNLLHTQL